MRSPFLSAICSMYTGTLICDLLATVERAEKSVARMLERPRPRTLTEEAVNDETDGRTGSEPEQFPEPLSLSAADRNLGLLFVVHPELVGTLEPGDDLADAVNVDEVGTVRPPKKIRI